ncbi:hypothetical protein TIFTF001_013823 [Ficus carica]|uniref:MYB transcription factor n=1 Tax=Ficus carica TaxID=3494 RepID=A0AA88A502_FICCA|nr:hypothetical protein TIFTF001_013823 [Ficus carica]
MGRKRACCDHKDGVRKGAWTPEEDQILARYIQLHGHGSWRSLPHHAGLLRCGKSCRLRWKNYLRPGIKRGPFSRDEESTIVRLHGVLGNRWAAIASHLEGRTDNEIKNYWNTHLKKRFVFVDGNKHQQNQSTTLTNHTINNAKIQSPATRHMIQWESVRLEAEVRLSTGSSLLDSSGDVNSDHFLLLWNSEVGKSFRDSTVLKKSSNVKLGSNSSLQMQVGYTPKANLESSSQCELSDSSVLVSEFLLDFPSGYDSDSLQGKEDGFAISIDRKPDQGCLDEIAKRTKTSDTC